jgi:hypothetical protein
MHSCVILKTQAMRQHLQQHTNTSAPQHHLRPCCTSAALLYELVYEPRDVRLFAHVVLSELQDPGTHAHLDTVHSISQNMLMKGGCCLQQIPLFVLCASHKQLHHRDQTAPASRRTAA